MSEENTAPPPHRQWLPYLDGWRGASVIAVLLGHFAPIPQINTGRLGVELFFCLSGRLMADILFVERFPLAPFILRRVTRVWPAFYVFVVLTAIAFAFSPTLHVRAPDIAAALTFTANYAAIYVERAPVYDHLWSLSVEEWAYVLLAGVALLCRSRPAIRPVPVLATLAALGIAIGVVQMARLHDYYAVYWRTDVRAASILMPCVAFLLLRGRRLPGWLPVAAGVLGLMLNINRVPDPIKYSLGTALLAISIATLEVAPAFVRRLLSMSWLRRIGLWSFSLYLWQQPLAKLEDIGVGWPLLRLAAVFPLAIASYYLVEQPARRALNRLVAHRQRTVRHAQAAKRAAR